MPCGVRRQKFEHIKYKGEIQREQKNTKIQIIAIILNNFRSIIAAEFDE